MSYILVTGSNGFIAEKLIDNLLHKNHKVIGLAKSNKKDRLANNYKHINLDITDVVGVESVFEQYNISTVIHLAAIAHLKGRTNIDWNTFYRVNTLASKSIFTLAKQYNAKVFYASTVDVYGDIKDSVIGESNTPNPMSDYAKSKYRAEKALEKEFQNSSDYIIARFAPVYAPNYMKDIYKRAFIKYPKLSYKIGSGYNYHFVSLNNVVEFISSWLELEDKSAGIYNIADDLLTNVNQLLLYEKRKSKSITIPIPSNLIPILNTVVKLSSKIVRISILEKIQLNLYKLINPPRYSNRKMKEIYTPNWDIENTVYSVKDN